MNQESQTPFLVKLCSEETRLVKALGWDHEQVHKAQRRFSDGYQRVLRLNESYRKACQADYHNKKTN